MSNVFYNSYCERIKALSVLAANVRESICNDPMLSRAEKNSLHERFTSTCKIDSELAACHIKPSN